MRKGYYKGFTNWQKWRREHAEDWRYLVGRPQTAPRQSWKKTIISHNLPDVPDGCEIDVTPTPGRTYTRYTWPPRGRGRGESLTSSRRMAAKLRTCEIIHLRADGYTWEAIGRKVGLSTSGAYRAFRRAIDRVDWDKAQRQQQKLNQLSSIEAEQEKELQ